MRDCSSQVNYILKTTTIHSIISHCNLTRSTFGKRFNFTPFLFTAAVWYKTIFTIIYFSLNKTCPRRISNAWCVVGKCFHPLYFRPHYAEPVPTTVHTPHTSIQVTWEESPGCVYDTRRCSHPWPGSDQIVRSIPSEVARKNKNTLFEVLPADKWTENALLHSMKATILFDNEYDAHVHLRRSF